MPDLTNIETLPAFYIPAFRLPSITAFNRLEASPRTTDFSRSLRAEVRDPLWMLTRQWQMGEFKGEDAATPVGARILALQQPADRVVFGKNTIRSYDEGIPIETRIERETLRVDLGFALELARAYWKGGRVVVGANRDALMAEYPLTFNPEANDYDATQLYESAQSRWWNGFTMYTAMISPSATPGATRFAAWLDSEASISPSDKVVLSGLVADFVAWYGRMYSQPASAAENAWKPSQLEYGFALATAPAQQNVLVADEYYQGYVDWYSFDLDNRRPVLNDGETVPTTPPEEGELSSFIPAPISFKGMPHPRFWQMEENQTDFGAIGASTTALLHLVFAEFGLLYSNDWFMLPFPLPFNSLCEVKGIVVTDVFGQETLIRPAGMGVETNWHRWAMYHHTDRAATSASPSNKFYLASSLTHFLESEPVESVNFLRDETANMVWAVEQKVPSLAGPGMRGDEMDIGVASSVPFTPAGNALIRYVAGTTVPSNWIPFIAVHLPGTSTEIQLQRARMPGAFPPRGRILTEVPAPFFVNEEEVPRAGVVVQRTWQRARWINGQTYLWLGRFKEPGRGEGNSDLRFDQLEDIAPPS
ncbi:MAG: hypothetical protein ABI877_00125 [Gemmatimonadaceae bacterium]